MEGRDRFVDALRLEFAVNSLAKRSTFVLQVETISFPEMKGGEKIHRNGY